MKFQKEVQQIGSTAEEPFTGPGSICRSCMSWDDNNVKAPGNPKIIGQKPKLPNPSLWQWKWQTNKTRSENN